MKYKIYSKEEITEYNKNPFVVRIIRNRFIEYDNVFKLWCVFQRKKYPEKTCRNIFSEAGFNVNLMNSKLPQARIKNWEDNYLKYGYDYFITSKKFIQLKNNLINDISVIIDDKSKLKIKIYNEVLKELKNV